MQLSIWVSRVFCSTCPAILRDEKNPKNSKKRGGDVFVLNCSKGDPVANILDISELDYTLRRFREMTYHIHQTVKKVVAKESVVQVLNRSKAKT